MLFKTPRSRVPDRPLADMLPNQGQQQQAAPKLLMKKRDGGMPTGIGIQARTDRNNSDQSQKTVQVSSYTPVSLFYLAHLTSRSQEREKEYAAARARIFGAESANPKPTTQQPKPERVPGNVAAGPDGSKG